MSVFSISRTQQYIERFLSIWGFFVVVCHMLLVVFRYIIPYERITAYIQWFTLGLVAFSLLYFVLSIVASEESRAHVLHFLKHICTFEQLMLVFLFLWFCISCFANGIKYSLSTIFFYFHDWLLFDMAVCVFIIFPMARAISAKKAKRLFEILVHIIVITYTVFAIKCLWHIFHNEVISFPSGELGGVTRDVQLMLGKHYNLTGMISATLFCLSIYMFFTQEFYLKILYGLFAFTHLIIIYLSNSRTVFVGVLAFVIFASFFVPWVFLHRKNIFIRLLASVFICSAISIVYWYGREGAFIAFESITHFSKELASEAKDITFSIKSYYPSMLVHTKETSYSLFRTSVGGENVRKLTELNSRQYVWNAAMRALGASLPVSLFGVTPYEVTDAIRNLGGYWLDVAHAHNIFLQVGLGLGLPALVFFLTFVLYIVFLSIKVTLQYCFFEKSSNVIIIGTLVCFFVINFAESYLAVYYSIMECFFFLICGYGCANETVIVRKASSHKRGKCRLKVAALLLSVVFALAMLCYSAKCLNINKSVITGSGTNTDPYIIENEKGLKHFRNLINRGMRFQDSYLLQTEDIYIKEEAWKPAGIYGTKRCFEGFYNGGNHNISYNGRKVDLFRYFSGLIKGVGEQQVIPKEASIALQDKYNLLEETDYYIEKDNNSVMVGHTIIPVRGYFGYDYLINKVIELSIFVHSPGERGSSIDNSDDFMYNRFGCHLTVIWCDSSGILHDKTIYTLGDLVSQTVENSRISGRYTLTPPNGYDTIKEISVVIQCGARPGSNNDAIWALGYPCLEIVNNA